MNSEQTDGKSSGSCFEKNKKKSGKEDMVKMKTKNSSSIRNMTLSAMFLAIGLILPFITGQIPQIGVMLAPMHLPVLLCGLICGWKYGLLIGFITPLLRSFLFGMPVLYPNAIGMAFELATYGSVSGYLYNLSKWQCLKALYASLISAMLSGRVVWGLVMIFLLSLGGGTFTWQMFISGALLGAIPGIIIQLTLIPAIMVMLNRTGLIRYRQEETAQV